MTNAMRMA